MYVKKLPEQPEYYGVTTTMNVLKGKWKPCLLESIHAGIRRPSELLRSIPEATLRVLNLQLKELEELNIVYKKIYPQVPPKVEYYLTEWGERLIPVITQMEQWGMDYSKQEVAHCEVKTS
ncbi:helix-turn-helix transcriptional regulator [Chitinophaga pendula]|uniref:winged helix-turn-helix transcriptional regulator n=1 Tax=Chitinophaga TaxID=79328 RepID=UPI000BB0599A|nr:MULTISPECIES: helix-turn-helix domain-containing protein [Chitinophaga]ASZ11218.1 transcriptional regulator [Chitinophaga sp. MD30]UCJ05785.1 helix-turn-helix transcriptional regulator [Chitinophaga pendula]